LQLTIVVAVVFCLISLFNNLLPQIL